MVTIPQWGIPNGKAPDPEVGPIMAGRFLPTSTQSTVTWDFGTDGSAANFKGVQSLYIDNSLNAKALRVTFYGGLFTVPIPANACGIIPNMSPEAQFGFRASFDGGGTGTADVCCVLFNIPQPFAVWKV